MQGEMNLRCVWRRAGIVRLAVLAALVSGATFSCSDLARKVTDSPIAGATVPPARSGTVLATGGSGEGAWSLSVAKDSTGLSLRIELPKKTAGLGGIVTMDPSQMQMERVAPHLTVLFGVAPPGVLTAELISAEGHAARGSVRQVPESLGVDGNVWWVLIRDAQHPSGKVRFTYRDGKSQALVVP